MDDVERKKKGNRELLYKALTDPKFRQMLADDPVSALGKKGELSPEVKTEVKLILAMVKGVENQIASVADILLCNSGGGGGCPTLC